MDLKLTEDDAVVCTHGWSRKDCKKTGMLYYRKFSHMTAPMFLEQTVHGMQTLDLCGLYGYMQRYPDLYWELDLHTLSYEKSVHMAEKLVEGFERNRRAFEHCLVQVNSMEMYEAIHSVYPFLYYQYNVKNEIERLDEFLSFCQEKGICAMALKNGFATPERVAKIRDAGLALLVFTVDSEARAKELFAMGVNTVCTNFIGIEQHVKPGEKEQEELRLLEQQTRIDQEEAALALVEKEKNRKRKKRRKLLDQVRKNLKEPHKIPGKVIRKLKGRG